MSKALPVFWLVGGPVSRRAASELLRQLKSCSQPITLGPPGAPEPDLDLGEASELALALESCPLHLRPHACVNLEEKAPPGLDCLPCPVMGVNGGRGLEGNLPDEPEAAVSALAAAATHGLNPAWLKRVQVNLPLVDLLGRFRALASMSPLNFEIGLDAPALDTLTGRQMDEAAGMLEGRRITAHLPFMDLAPASVDPQVAAVAFRRLLNAADLALKLKAKQAVLHLGFDPRLHREPDEFARRLAKSLGPVVSRLAAGGCRFVLENCFEPNPKVLLLARQALAEHGQVGFCLDVGHALAFSQTSLPDWWQALAPHLWELHLHDNDGTDDLHWPCGWGAVEWDFLGRALKEKEPRPILTLEPHKEPHLWASLRNLERLWGVF